MDKLLNKTTIDFYIARGFKVKIINRQKYIVKIDNVCPHLTEDNKCDIQDSKPFNCRVYPEGVPKQTLMDGCAFKEK